MIKWWAGLGQGPKARDMSQNDGREKERVLSVNTNEAHILSVKLSLWNSKNSGLLGRCWHNADLWCLMNTWLENLCVQKLQYLKVAEFDNGFFSLLACLLECCCKKLLLLPQLTQGVLFLASYQVINVVYFFFQLVCKHFLCRWVCFVLFCIVASDEL